MNGDCSIRINGLGFTPEEVADCAQRKGLLSFELELIGSGQCGCSACVTAPQSVLSLEETLPLFDQAIELGAKRCILIDHGSTPVSRLSELLEALHGRNIETELFTDGKNISTDFARLLAGRNTTVVLNHDESPAISLFLHAGYAEESRLSAYIPLSPGVPGEVKEGDGAEHTIAQAGYGTPDGPRLAVRLTVDAQSVDDLPRRWRLARSRGIEPWVQIMSAEHRGGQTVSPQRRKALFKELSQIDRDEFGITWELPPSLTGRSCKRHLFACHVTPCGTIFACVGVTIPLGNIRTQALRSILDESEVLENIRAFEQKVKEPCFTCCKTTDCYGCRGSAYRLTGDYLAGDQLCWKAAGIEIPALPVNVGGLIPHGPSIRMVNRLTSVGEREAHLEFVVRADSAFVDADGRLDETAYIEMIAQSFAASHGFHMSPQELANHRGMLIGAKDLIVSRSARVGDRLIIHLRKVARFGDFGVVEGSIFHDDGTLLATCEVKVWRPSDEVLKKLQS